MIKSTYTLSYPHYPQGEKERKVENFDVNSERAFCEVIPKGGERFIYVNLL